MNRWHTWRARLEHLLFPQCECLCTVCSRARTRQLVESVKKPDYSEKLKCPKT
jgi:hypothetical protein